MQLPGSSPGDGEDNAAHLALGLRAVHDYITEQQNDARVSAGFGMFFKGSTDTKWASQTMSDNLHIVADSKNELGIYSITLDPPMSLQPHPKLMQHIDYLPKAFDSAAYQRFSSPTTP